MSSGLYTGKFICENLPQSKSVLLYASCSEIGGIFLDHALKIVKHEDGIEVTYEVINHENTDSSFVDSFVIPCLSSNQITEDDIDGIIAKLQEKYPDEKFISAVSIELEKFKDEIRNKTNPYPKMMPKLASMSLINFDLDSILANAEALFREAREQYFEMYSSSLVSKEK